MNELCQRYQESFGDPNPPQELVRHGEECEVCREFAQCQIALEQALPSWKTPQFSDDFALSVMSRVAEDGAQRRSFGDLLREMFQIRLAIPLPVGALASVLLIASLFLNYTFWTQPQNKPFNGGFQTAKVGGNAQLTRNPLDENTPVAIPVTKGATIDGNGIHGPLIVPSEFLGAGAFLLVPILDQNASFNQDQNTNNQSDGSLGI